MGGRAGEDVGQGAQPGYHCSCARAVEVGHPRTCDGVLRDDPPPDQEGNQPDRRVHPEDELPAGPRGDPTSDEDAGCNTEAADRAPEREGDPLLVPGVGRGHQGQGRRRERGSAETLCGTGDDQLPTGPG